MYVQCYDKRGNRHNFNVAGVTEDFVRQHLTLSGYGNISIVPFVFRG